MDITLKLKKKYLDALKRIYDDVLLLAPHKSLEEIVLDVHRMLTKRVSPPDYNREITEFIRRNK
jgi:hypothetical protein